MAVASILRQLKVVTWVAYSCFLFIYFGHLIFTLMEKKEGMEILVILKQCCYWLDGKGHLEC